MNKALVIIALTCFLASCGNNGSDTPATTIPANDDPIDMGFTVVNLFPHDTTSFTEGLVVHDGQLYESTGHPPGEDFPSTRSLFGKLDLKTGKIQPIAELDKKKYFGEGIVFLNGKIYQLTLSTKIGFIYDAKTFKKIGEFTFPMKEGWGMTTDGTYLIMTDGSSNISYLDPNNFKLIKILGVNNNNGFISNLNELEYIDGYLYANQYLTNNILKIDPASGKVVGRANFDSLKKEQENKYPDAIDMNGIAYDSAAKKIYITGKMWPNIYEIKFNH